MAIARSGAILKTTWAGGPGIAGKARVKCKDTGDRCADQRDTLADAFFVQSGAVYQTEALLQSTLSSACSWKVKKFRYYKIRVTPWGSDCQRMVGFQVADNKEGHPG